MTTWMQDSAEFVIDTHQYVAGVLVTYGRGPLVSDPIIGVHTLVEMAVDELETYGVAFESHCWEFRPQDLVVGGDVIIPQQGDTITEVLGTTEIVYEVMPVASGAPPKEPTDASRTATIVYAKRIK